MSCSGIPILAQASWIAVGFLGLITGSFLNAVIHRLPLGISLLNPSRSFCTRCGKTIPWYENLPVASWVLLQGRCSGCTLPIAIRYPLVELLTAGLYLLAWGRFGLPLAPVFWLFLSLLVAATFIEVDHLIIPDEITLGGTAAGILCATLLPRLMGAAVWWQGLAWSALGAGLGYVVLWSVVELGKRAFGKKRIRTEGELLLEITGDGTDPILTLAEERMPLAELFYRESDRAEASCVWLEIDGARLESGMLKINCQGVRFGDRTWSYAEITEVMPIRAGVTELILPREAMGFGDVKFLACIGAFLGWKGVLFTLFSGSITGAIIGVAMLAATKGRSGGRIPFGPYLALGALLWVVAGPELIDLYLGWISGSTPGDGFLLLLHRASL